MKRSWIFVLPLVLGFLWLGGAPSQASGELFKVNKVIDVGCATGNWNVNVTFSGLDAADGYIAHTVVTSQGNTYMNEDAGSPQNVTENWNLESDADYGPVTSAWPIAPGHPMKASRWNVPRATCCRPGPWWRSPATARPFSTTGGLPMTVTATT
jgi:hypothetical protein